MEQLFYELIEEAKEGKILIDNEIWPVGFNTKIYNDDNLTTVYENDQNLTMLEIKRKKVFFELLEKYINLELMHSRKMPNFYQDKNKNQQKMLMAYLFVNATTEEFLYPEELLKRKINFLEDKTFSNYDVELDVDALFPNCKLKIKNYSQSIFMETPNKIEISLIKEVNDKKEEFFLPEISYGIITNKNNEKECFIYSILDPNKDREKLKQNSLAKSVIRKLYKVNDGVYEQESSEYHAYKNQETDYYPENIADVSPSAVISLTIFLLLLKTKQITSIKGVPYLPLRYLSRKIMANDQKDELKKDELLKRNDNIQHNITEKFIRTFRRASYHLPDFYIETFPYEIDEFINMKIISNSIKKTNHFVNDVATEVESKIKRG